LTEDGVRPAYKLAQHTIILRDVPSGTSSEVIQQIFPDEYREKIKSIRSELNDTWYRKILYAEQPIAQRFFFSRFLTFGSEEEARDAILSIQGAKLDGQPIRARLKTESMAKNYYKAFTEQAHVRKIHEHGQNSKLSSLDSTTISELSCVRFNAWIWSHDIRSRSTSFSSTRPWKHVFRELWQAWDDTCKFSTPWALFRTSKWKA
jgi:hypothetical protein